MIFHFKHRIILLTILTTILIYAFFSEKILPAHGLGFDGAFYGDFTINFKQYIKNHSINKYYFQRLALPFVIYNFFSLLKINLTTPNVILAYSILNILFVFIGVYFFFHISNFLKLSKPVEIIGFAALFFCFPVLKFSLYYPVLMDIAAFSISIILVYLYLKRKLFLFFIVILIGSFIYPTFILLSILFFFNVKPENATSEINTSKQNSLFSILNKINILHILSCFLLPVCLIYMYIILFWRNSYHLISEEFRINPGNTALIWFSFLLALSYVVYLNFYRQYNFSFKKTLKATNYIAIGLTIVVFLLTKLLIDTFASKDKVPLTIENYLYAVIFQAVKNPLNFIAAHVFYFGIAPLVSLFMIKDIKREVSNFGLGMILFFNVVIFFSVGSESRQLINYYPFLIMLLLTTLNKYWEVSLKFSVLFVTICISLSHFWYNINKGLSADMVYTDYFSLFEFPRQRYFMFQGPWVSDFMYKIHFAVCFIIVVLLFYCFKKTKLILRKT